MNQEVIVILNHLAWDWPCDYIKQTSLELAKRARVIIFNPLSFPTLKTLLTDRKKRNELLDLLKSKELMFFPSVGILPFQRVEYIKRFNVWLNLIVFRFYYFVKFGLNKPIFWACSDYFYKIIDNLNWGKLIVYDRVDQIASLDPQENEKVQKQDRALLASANLVFVNSPYALNYVKKINKNSYLVPCGCDVNLFVNHKTDTPKELKKIKKPIIGMVGNIDHRLDFGILYPLIKKRQDWNFVFVGGQFFQSLAQFKIKLLIDNIAKLKQLPNTFFLGLQSKDKMPDFIRSFDVCLIPYDMSLEFVRGCNPMKLYEYLAMGKPVVSAPIEAVKVYEPVVKTVGDFVGFEKTIERILDSKDDPRIRRRRKKISEENSWHAKRSLMWLIIEDFLTGRREFKDFDNL